MKRDANYVQIHYLSDEIKRLDTTYFTEDNQILVFFAPDNILKQLPKVTLDNIGRYVHKFFREIELKYLNQYVGPIKRLVVWKLKSEPTLRLGYLGTMYEIASEDIYEPRITVRFESFRTSKKVWDVDYFEIDKIWRLGS